VLREQRQFAGLHWEAQALLEANRQIVRRLQPQLRAYILARARGWEGFFPAEKELLTGFFEKAKRLPQDEMRRELRREFRKAIGQPQERGPGPRRPPTPADLTPEQVARMDEAFERYVLGDRDFTTALVVVAFGGESAPPDTSWCAESLRRHGYLLRSVHHSREPRADLSELLTGCGDALKGKHLRYPSLFEYVGKQLRGKATSYAFCRRKGVPPLRSRAKGFGKKYGPVSLCAADLESAAETVRAQIGEARSAGKSRQYIQVMVRDKLTPKELRVDKLVKDEALAQLAVQMLPEDRAEPGLGPEFLQRLALACLHKGVPDMLFVDLDHAGVEEDEAFVRGVWSEVQSRLRYRGRTVLLVVDRARSMALVTGPGVSAGSEGAGPYSLRDISATLAGLADVHAPMCQGEPISGLSSH